MSVNNYISGTLYIAREREGGWSFGHCLFKTVIVVYRVSVREGKRERARENPRHTLSKTIVVSALYNSERGCTLLLIIQYSTV